MAKGQQPFQPGATPSREKKRYLGSFPFLLRFFVSLTLGFHLPAFNMIGYIHTVEREEYNIMSVDFHDRSSHVSMRFDDNIKYTVAALGTSYLLSPISTERLISLLYFR